MAPDPRFNQVDATVVPRFADVATFMRTRRHDASAEVDIGLVGVPFDYAGLATNKGARVRLAAQGSTSPRFMVTYGDGIGDVDISALLAFHRNHGRLATVTGYQPFSQYGMLDVDDQGRVREMREKPRLPQWVNAGFMVFERAALDFFGVDDGVDLEKDVLPKLVAGGELMMYRHAGYWSSMDTFKDAQVLSDAWEAGAPWKLWSE